LGEVFAAHQCPRLRCLYLSNNRISVEGVSAFFDVLTPQSLSDLQLLSLEGQEGLDSREEQTEFDSSVRALRAAAHANGRLVKWKDGSRTGSPLYIGEKSDSDESSDEM